ncbi:hypothetical protein [Anaerocaecibacter muris]|uniref:hypothetical protein n=1 Tax=Anaerocaecibacter muris TaxID=2941513 RepID=UPI00203ADAF9|nr:hypothetical protein [Anaerocaecibacter muris]
MKMTKKRLAFFLLHLLFSAVVPIVLVIVRYSTITNTKAAIGFKISITGILLLIFIFWVIKKLFIDRKLTDLKAQGNIMLADLKTKQDPAEIAAIEKELKKIKTAEALFGSIIPLLFIVAAVIAFKALEAQLVTLSATLGYIGISYGVGLVFNVLYSREIHAKNGGTDNGDK